MKVSAGANHKALNMPGANMFKRIAIAAIAAWLAIPAQAEEFTTQNLRQSIELAQRTTQLTKDMIHARSGLLHDVYRNNVAAQEADRCYDGLYMHVVAIDSEIGIIVALSLLGLQLQDASDAALALSQMKQHSELLANQLATTRSLVSENATRCSQYNAFFAAQSQETLTIITGMNSLCRVIYNSSGLRGAAS
jgi:hypothetical protein